MVYQDHSAQLLKKIESNQLAFKKLDHRIQDQQLGRLAEAGDRLAVYNFKLELAWVALEVSKGGWKERGNMNTFIFGFF